VRDDTHFYIFGCDRLGDHRSREDVLGRTVFKRRRQFGDVHERDNDDNVQIVAQEKWPRLRGHPSYIFLSIMGFSAMGFFIIGFFT
jgi:hypothetical protein